MAKINLVAPWDEYYNEMVAFFAEDPDVTILYDDSADEKQIKVLVQRSYKAEALTNLLNTEKIFGNVKLNITVIPANEVTSKIKKFFKDANDGEDYNLEYCHALDGNELFSYSRTIEYMMGFNAVFVVFQKKVVQYYNDNLGDLNGMKSTLAEDIARDIFIPHNGVFFCTDTRDVNETLPVAHTLYTN